MELTFQNGKIQNYLLYIIRNTVLILQIKKTVIFEEGHLRHQYIFKNLSISPSDKNVTS